MPNLSLITRHRTPTWPPCPRWCDRHWDDGAGQVPPAEDEIATRIAQLDVGGQAGAPIVSLVNLTRLSWS